MTEPDGGSERRLDANAAGGPLGELFTVDLTAAVATCASCGSSGPLAEHHLYADAPALVVRCRNCTAVVLRYADGGGTIRFEMTGTRLLTVALPTDTV